MNASVIQFKGPLADEFAQFVTQMQATGGNHTTLFRTIIRLDNFLSQMHPNAAILSRDVLFEWFNSFAHLKPLSQQRYRSATFNICKFLHHRNLLTAVREEFIPLRVLKTFIPYIFSKNEIAQLLQAARSLTIRPVNPLRPLSMELIIVLLYTAGLRIGEAIRLNIQDYDPTEGTLRIIKTKFAKSRLVPLSTSAKNIVNQYLSRRHELGLSCEPENSLIWSPRCARASIASAQDALINLLRQCGLKPQKGREGPRVHDIRHTFATHRILKWYQEGKNVQALLPYLSTYMGHCGIESTQYYLRFIPEVLEEASKRFAKFCINNMEVNK